MTPSPKGTIQTTALVLSGGGAKCAFQAGALEVLNEAGFKYNAISGVSGGALNGAMIATGQLDELLKVWHGITPDKVLRKQSLVALARRSLFYKLGWGDPPVSRYRNDPLLELIEEQLLGKQVMLPYHFGYVKLESGTYVKATVRQTEEHNIDQADVQRILASTAIPVYFNPVYIGDDTCVDGGLRNISPIKQVLPYQPDRLVIIPTEPFGESPEHEEVRDILEIAFRSITIMLDEIFEEDLDRFLTINRLVQQAEAEDLTLTKTDGTFYKYIEPLMIDPEEQLGDPLDFSNQRVQDLIKLGRQRARKVLEESSKKD
ncbi:MAG: patatin-like phospholipase family protein [Balneolaceae bacterium]|nr:patatin-like phospholipase family protein [Balneolaceae bacterium]